MLYFTVHFLTEAACFFWLTDRVGQSELFVLFALSYDLLAFVPQLFFGMIKDRFRNFKMGFTGALMMILALMMPWNVPSLIILAIGNALIHVEGAEATLSGAGGKMSPSAFFVSGGSFGIIAGKLLAQYCPRMGFFAVLGGMIISGILLSAAPIFKNKSSASCGFSVDAPQISTGLLVFLSIITVASRGYVAYSIPTSWNKTVLQTVLLYVFMGVGKALGGIIADRFDVRKTACFSLLLAIPFLVFGDRVMIVSLAGILLFSMTMPISLAVLVSRFGDRPGFSFGITTLGLFLGTLPAFFFVPKSLISSIIILISLCLLACMSFAICIRKGEKKDD